VPGTRKYYGLATPVRGYPTRVLQARGYSPPPSDEQPRFFFSFKHNELITELTGKMKQALAREGVEVYRAIDDPRPGESLRQKILDGITNTHGTVLFWSGEGSNSAFVKWEYQTAKDLGKRVCLIKFPDVPEPDGWNPDVEWVPLQGVRFLARPALIGSGRVWLDIGGYPTMIQTVKAFGVRARDAASPSA
jgi:hypothetical protein